MERLYNGGNPQDRAALPLRLVNPSPLMCDLRSLLNNFSPNTYRLS
ncbi:hypothetical protein VB711_25830 [Cronbergia sp. UHCC 0137]|nr:hypothetical protein [Cronbergia sp. UHCC 0137]MEA5621229.1 hypothetical protein [Cronbergia sp. UHCC 0137]